VLRTDPYRLRWLLWVSYSTYEQLMYLCRSCVDCYDNDRDWEKSLIRLLTVAGTCTALMAYYRAMNMPKRGLCCHLVYIRLSVCLSRSYCIQTAKDVVKFLFFHPGNPITLVSWGHPVLPSSNGTHSAEALNTREWKKLAIFDWNRRLSRKP